MEKQYKPGIGKIVYTLCSSSYGIQKDKVGYIGKDGFVVGDFSEYRDFDSLHYLYEDYNETWFTSFKEARRKVLDDIRKLTDSKVKIRKINSEYWEVEFE